MISNNDDDDAPHLSAETFLVLQQFYREQEERETIALESKHIAETEKDIDIAEDWQLSQFWYDAETIDTLVNIALKTINNCGNIALLSCPSLFKKMKKQAGDKCTIHLYEYDKRFAIHGEDFSFYDYKSPLDVPKERREHYDLVIADPPFLSDECLTKTAVTIKYLSKEKIILCTGATMAEMASRLLSLEKTAFSPHHTNNLANEFCCYANFDINKFL